MIEDYKQMFKEEAWDDKKINRVWFEYYDDMPSYTASKTQDVKTEIAKSMLVNEKDLIGYFRAKFNLENMSKSEVANGKPNAYIDTLLSRIRQLNYIKN